MDALHSLIRAVLVIVALYALALLMRRRGVLSEDHSLILARIVTDLCLPAIVFVTLARQSVRLDQLAPAGVMLGLELSCIAVAWAASALLGFSKAQQGAVVFCSAFGSSTFLGYSLITQMFPTQPQAMTEAVLISEIGVGYPIFILGPILAAYFGSAAAGCPHRWSASLRFFRSPVFFALLAGLVWGLAGLPGADHEITGPLFQLCHILASALTPLAILSVGLMLRVPDVRQIALALAVVVLLKLLVKPVAAGLLASAFGFPKLWQDVLVLLAGMPPAVLGAVFLRRYGGDASLASALLLVATVLSCVSLLGVFWFIG